MTTTTSTTSFNDFPDVAWRWYGKAFDAIKKLFVSMIFWVLVIQMGINFVSQCKNLAGKWKQKKNVFSKNC